MIGFYSRFIREGDLCFDVGANLGDRTGVFLKLGAAVVAIEPQDFCMRQLRKRFGKNGNVILVQKALGEEEGEGELIISKVHTLSSMSREWINKVSVSGRFKDDTWGEAVRVPVTTLDNLIVQYGEPAFCKIDVEGYEVQVLKGLSCPIRTISFEFVSEYIESTLLAISLLAKIGIAEYNYSIAESMRLALPKWVDSENIGDVLVSLPDKGIWGDVYARFIRS